MHIHLLIARLLCWWITASQVTWWRPFWSRQKIQVRRWPNVDSKGLELGIPKRGVPFLSAKNWPSYCLTSHASFWNWCLALAISLNCTVNVVRETSLLLHWGAFINAWPDFHALCLRWLLITLIFTFFSGANLTLLLLFNSKLVCRYSQIFRLEDWVPNIFKI